MIRHSPIHCFARTTTKFHIHWNHVSLGSDTHFDKARKARRGWERGVNIGKHCDPIIANLQNENGKNKAASIHDYNLRQTIHNAMENVEM